MNASTWFYGQSFHSSTVVAPAPAPASKTLVLEQWDGRQFVEREVVWNGHSYEYVEGK